MLQSNRTFTQRSHTANSTNVILFHEVLNAKAFNIWIYWPQSTYVSNLESNKTL